MILNILKELIKYNLYCLKISDMLYQTIYVEITYLEAISLKNIYIQLVTLL